MRIRVVTATPIGRGTLHYAVSAAATAVVGATLLLSVTSTAVQPSPTAQLLQHKILPEGWAFFTLNPHTPTMHLFARRSTGWQDLTTSYGSPQHLFGIKRDGRALAVQVAVATAKLTPADWDSCKLPLQACLSQQRPIHEVQPERGLRLCGDFVVARKEPLPWAYRHLSAATTSGQYLSLRIRC